MTLTNTLFDTPTETETSRLTRRVESEYSDMPGLSLTMAQAQRLLNIDRQRCTVVLKALISRKFLRRTAEGQYVRF
jgi:hypothetical protein